MEGTDPAMEGEASRGETPGLRIEMLGHFAVWVGERLVEEVYAQSRAARLLQFLALQDGCRAERDRVIRALWPDARSGPNTFHQALRAARALLEPDLPRAGRSLSQSVYLPMRGDLLLLHPAGAPQVDVQAFRAALQAARAARTAAAYDVALERYTGPLLPAVRERWADSARGRLRDELAAGLREAIELHLREGDPAGALRHARRLVRVTPASIAAQATLLRLAAERGDGDTVLHAYDVLRKLARKQDVELDADLHELAGRVIEGSGAGAGVPWPSEAAAPVPAAAPSSALLAAEQEAAFIGRERELRAIMEDLGRSRLVTITGAGGAGKTRLALRAALRWAGAAPDAACAVELAPLSDPEQVPLAVALALGLPESHPARLVRRVNQSLAGRELLLVLDNCEHLRAACAALVGALLAGCPTLCILATSREPLSVEGELVYPLAPLGLPPEPGDVRTAATARQSDAVLLFCRRAAESSTRFALTDANAGVVAQICRQLDGLPLALELAAAQVRFLALEDIAARLDRPLDVLGANPDAPPRQRTMDATLAWSYGRLTPEEAALFRRLAVFAGGWTLDAAESVCAGADVARGQIVRLLGALIERSLVTVEERNGGLHYRLLEPARQYAERQLEAAGEAARLRRRHAVWYAWLARRAEPRLAGREQPVWLARLTREGDNLRAALRWARDHAPTTVGLRAAGPLARYWALQGLFGEGRRWLEAMTARVRARPGERVSPAYAKALYGEGWLVTMQGDFARGLARARRCVRIWRAQGDVRAGMWAAIILGAIAEDTGKTRQSARFQERGIALAREAGERWREAVGLSNLGDVLLREGRYAEAWERYEACLALARQLEDEAAIGMALTNLGRTAVRLGRLDEGVALIRRGLEKARALGDARATGDALLRLGHAEILVGRLADAAEAFGEALTLHQRAGHVSSLVVCYEGFATLANALGMHAEAIQLAAFALALRDSAGTAPFAADADERERRLRALRRRMGARRYAAAWAVGRALSTEDAARVIARVTSRARQRGGE